jgi:ABC-type histidine transport system ATPase subunit
MNQNKYKTSRSRNQTTLQTNLIKKIKTGVAVILQAFNKNHHIAIIGIKLIKPPLTKRLLLPNRS